jgi:cytochrome c
LKFFLVCLIILISTQISKAEINQLFIKNCATCHSVQKGDTTLRAGPNLWSVVGRKAATDQSYTMYSDAIKKSGIVWNEENLNKWLTNAGAFIPGTNMYYMQADESVRLNIIDYLKTLK